MQVDAIAADTNMISHFDAWLRIDTSVFTPMLNEYLLKPAWCQFLNPAAQASRRAHVAMTIQLIFMMPAFLHVEHESQPVSSRRQYAVEAVGSRGSRQ